MLPTELLLPEDRRLVAMEDSSHLLAEPDLLRSAARESGYLFFRGFLPDTLVAAVREFTREAFSAHGWVESDGHNSPTMRAVQGAKLTGRGWDDQNWFQFQSVFSKHPDFLQLAEAPSVMAVLEAVMDEPAWLASTNFCWIKLPGSPAHTTLPHQDEWYLPSCKSMWTMWLPLVHTPFDVGPLGVVPGSHKHGLQEHIDAFSGMLVDPEKVWASNEMRAGDVVFFSARTIHCAWSNVSPTLARVSADVRYEPRSVGRNSKLRTF